MKYITTEDNAIIIFSEGFSHLEIAVKTGVSVRGAGFVNSEIKGCFGKSHSLDIPKHEDDDNTLSYHNRGY